MADFDILTFLEYYPNKSSVLDSNGKRSPTLAHQNFYQNNQVQSADSAIDQSKEFTYLAFDANGFASTEATDINTLSINIAATASIVDLTETALTGDRLVIASLYTQTIGQETFSNSATLICRYIGTIESASIDDISVTWNITPAISKQKPQIPTRRISSDLLGRFVTT